MASPTRYPSGVTNVDAQNPLGQYGLPDPSKWHTFFDDFDTYNADDWTVTETGAATQAITDEDGGVLLITNAGTDNDASWSDKVGESFLLATGKRAAFKARFRVSSAIQTDAVIGLQVTTTDPLTATDGIYFITADESAALAIVCRKNTTTGSTTAANIATLVDATYLTVAWYYDGKGNLAYFINDVQQGTLAVTDYLPDTELTISYGVMNGSAGGKTMSIDYIFAAKER